MSNSSRFNQLATALIFIILLALIAGQLLGQPVGLSYVETESMSPMIDSGDGFIAVPTTIDDTIQEGDVIVFQAEELHGGGLTTHRVVDQTERGYITQGDANPFTDQDGDEPPVKEPQVVAKALQTNGDVVVIPHLGTLIEGIQSVLELIQRQLAAALGTSSVLGTQGLAYLVFAVTLVWYAIGEWRDRTTNQSDRTAAREAGMNTRLVVGVFAALLVLGATAAMVGPAGTQEYGVVSAEFDSERPSVIPQGESTNLTYPVDNGGIIPIVAYLEPASEGVAVSPHESHVGPRSVANATVTLQAPPETGHYRRFVTEHRYLGILPLPVIQTLYAVHPWAPIVAIDAMIGLPFYRLGIGLVGTGRIRDRSLDRGYGLLTRLRRLVGGLY